MSPTSSAWDRVYADLKARIETGALGSGSRIPSQTDLSQSYGVPRHVVRRAIERLKQDGLIGSWQGRGAYVPARKQVYRIDRQTRFGTNMRENGCDVRIEILVLRQRGRASAEVAKMLAVSQRETVLVSEILHVVDAVPTTIGRHYFDPKRFPDMLDLMSASASSPAAFKRLGIDHYTRSETTVNTRLPTPSEAVTLDIAPSQPVFELVGCNVDERGSPIEVTEAIVRGDRIRLLI